MILEFQNNKQIKNPNSDEVQQAIDKLDGFKNSYFKVFKRNKSELLIISVAHNSKFYASIQTISGDIEKERNSKNLLSKNKVVKLIDTWSKEKTLIPLMIRWEESMQLSDEASKKELHDFRTDWEKEPLKMSFKTVYHFLFIFSVMLAILMLLDYYLDKGFVSMLFYDISLTNLWLSNTVIAFIISLLIFIGTWPVKEDYDKESY